MPDRNCHQCGTAYTPKRKDARFCSKPCMKTWHRVNRTGPCTVEGCEKVLLAKGMCGTHYQRTYYPNRSHADADPTAKARRDLIRAKARRAKTKGAANPEKIDRDLVADRDGWVCWLCGTDVDREARWPNTLCASLDHVVPLSRGGQHTYTNVRLAHFICNTRRQATPAPHAA